MQTEKAFKKTMIKIGTAMLLFLAFFNTLGTIYALIDVFASMTLSPTKAYVFSQLFYAAIYLTSFMVPAVILNKMMGKERVPMMFEKKLPLDFAAYIFAAEVSIKALPATRKACSASPWKSRYPGVSMTLIFTPLCVTGAMDAESVKPLLISSASKSQTVLPSEGLPSLSVSFFT